MKPFAADLIVERCGTVGSGDLDLLGAVEGFGAFGVAVQAGPVYYAIDDGFNRETGIGVFDGNRNIGRSEILTTIFDGIYNNDNPRAIPLSGNAIVACTANVDVFLQLQSALEGKEDAFSKNTAFNKNFGETADTVTEGFAKNSGFNKDFGDGTGTVCEGDDFRLNNDRDPTPHDHNDIYFQKDEHQAESVGVASSNLPVITDVNGKLSTTFLEFNALSSQGAWTPVEGTEYPTITAEPLGSFWGISDVDAIDGYTFHTGDLTGLVAKNSDVIIWATNGWALIKTNIVPEIYYRRDGEQALTAPLNAGNNLLSNVLAAVSGTDAPNLTQMIDALALKEDAFDKNSAFNKNFGDLAGTVTEGFAKNGAFNRNYGSVEGTTCQGNDPRLDDSRPPNPHDHDDQYFRQDQFIEQSLGAIDAGAPVKVDSNGRLSLSFFDISGLVFQGGWTPTAGDEYPDTGAVDAGAFWMIDGVPEPAGYLFAGGDLAGQTGYSGDIMLYGSRGWVLREVSLEPTAYYRLDGTYSLLAPFQAGNQQLKNVAQGVDGTDGVIVTQLNTQIATREPTISPKNNAFNKNYGSVAGTTCQGSDARLSNSRPPTAHTHAISEVTNLQTELNGKEPANANIQTHIAGRANPHAVTATQVGLGNCNNTSDAAKPVSSATQTALNLKANLASPAMTGAPTAPTAAEATDNTQLANTAFVKRAVDSGGGDEVIWAVFNGLTAGTNPPLAGVGISEIQKNGTGSWTIRFSTPQPNALYSITALGQRDSGSDAGYTTIPRDYSPSESSFALNLRDANGNSQEGRNMFIQVVGP